MGEEAKRYGKLTVLPTRINADLGMGDLLKKTGAGNLFMIFGEPDIEIRDAKKTELPSDAPKDARVSDYVVMEVRGLDVYDPTTGEVRSSSIDDIACWFIDRTTTTNPSSFGTPISPAAGSDKLKRALRAEVDERAWATLYSTTQGLPETQGQRPRQARPDCGQGHQPLRG